MQKQKAQSKLNGLARLKLVAVILNFVVTVLGVLIYGNQLRNIYFTVSVGMIIVITIAAIVYIYHITLIKSIDHSQNIADTQKTCRVTGIYL